MFAADNSICAVGIFSTLLPTVSTPSSGKIEKATSVADNGTFSVGAGAVIAPFSATVGPSSWFSADSDSKMAVVSV